MKQAGKVMLVSDLLHDLHRQLVVIDGNIGRFKYRCQLMLGRGNLVMLGLDRNSQLPQLHLQVMHIGGNLGLQNAEIMILHLLTLGCGCAKQGPPRKEKVLSLLIKILVDQKVFLLRSDRGKYAVHVLISQDLHHLHSFTVQCLHGP